MNINASTLPEDSLRLKQMLLDFQSFHEKETGILLEEIRLLRARLYGRKSEKIVLDSGMEQLPLFDMPEPVAEEQEKEITVPEHSRKKGGRKPLPADLPRVEVVHDLSEEEKICTCGAELTRISEETSEQLDIIPAKIQVIRHIRPKYACKQCEGAEEEKGAVKIADVEPQIIPKSIASPGLLASILTGKFVDHTPFYRQEQQFLRLGVDVSRTSMCNWAMKSAEACQPLLNLLLEEVLDGIYIHVDETPLQVLKEPGRSPTTTSYMWLFRRGDPDRPVLIFQYHPTREGDVAAAFLRGFEGYVQTDGYSGYNFLDLVEKIRHIGCFAHVRRKFTDVVKALGKTKKPIAATEALNYIKKLYKLEKEARKNGLTAEEIYRLRQEKAVPILDEFKKWLRKHSTQTPPKGLLGKAISYTLGQWERLIGYLEDGRLKMDNNAAENSIRPFVIGRKNWLFAGTPRGAEASALLYSLIETAKANKLEPYAYLRYIFEHLPKATSLEDYEALLPWKVALGKTA